MPSIVTVMPVEVVVTTTWCTALRSDGIGGVGVHVVQLLLSGVGGGDASEVVRRVDRVLPGVERDRRSR